MNSTKPLILVDGSSYLYRAFHALPPLVNSSGQPTGAIYGVVNMIRKLIKTYSPEYIAVVFDTKAKTFRDELYHAYKANRKVMPDELVSQIEPLYEMIQMMGLPLICIDGVEADDVIGTLAHRFSSHYPILISTGDKDMAQLVNNNITLVNTMNDFIMNEKSVEEKFGITPSQIIDYLILIGDISDNIPGVAGVGPKTAAKWLKQYHTLKNIIQHRHEIKGKLNLAFEQALENFELTRKLITIKCDVDEALRLDLESFKIQSSDKSNLIVLLKKLEFKSWLSEMTSELSPSEINALSKEKNTRTKNNLKNYQCIFTVNDLEKLIQKLEHTDLFSIDTETTSLNIIDAKLVGISFGFIDAEAYYIPVGHHYCDVPIQLSREIVLEKLKPLLEDEKHSKIGHHIKYDINILKNVNIHLKGIKYDTMLESYMLNSHISRHDMDSLALKHLGKKTIHFEDIAGKGAKQLTFDQIDIAIAAEYAAEDADVTFQLHQKLSPMLEKDRGLLNTFEKIEIPLLSVLAEMERYGVLINAELLQKQSQILAERIHILERQAFQETGKMFNLSSPKQLQEILYQQLNIPILEKTPTGQPSTSESVLQELAKSHSLPKIILEHRTLSKLKSTYTDKLPEQINSKTLRVHTSYHQAGTSTGRLSSSNPNLQNIPIRTEEGRNIRKAFIAPSGYKILSADYSQIELRIMAHLSQDKNLLHAFEKELDIHSATASEIFNVNISQVTFEQRRRAKAINFGLIYGMSSFGLAKQLDISREMAQEYIDIYFTRYPKVKEYMSEMKTLAHQQGYVTTLYGRQLHLPEINARNSQRQKAAERAAINAPLQGSAADLIKLAMINIQDELTIHQLPAKMIMQVHDELVFEVHENYIDSIKNKIKTLMENSLTLSIPITVSIGIGNNWDEAH